jgi:hypothetical protein
VAITPSDEVPFDEDGLGAITGVLGVMVATRSGWMNLLPEVEPEFEQPPRGMLASIFSGRGRAVPMATIATPEEADQELTVGIEHGAGPKALDRLSERQLPLPDGWRKLADHPRRGLVLAAPLTTDLDDLLWWVLAAGHALSPVPLTGSWLARVYKRS